MGSSLLHEITLKLDTLQHSKYAHKAAGLVLFLLCTECAMLFLFQVRCVFVVASDVRAGRLSFFLKLCLVYQVSLVYVMYEVKFSLCLP